VKLLVISGLSGSGKSIALRTLEDLGYYCIDNLPVSLLPEFAKNIGESSQSNDKIAVGIDARNMAAGLKNFPQIIDKLKRSDIECEILFIEADDNTLLKRFSETRRKHPLTSKETSLHDAIQKERTLLGAFSENADLHIDTSDTNVHQLRDLIRERVAARPASMSLLFESFGYKNGIPVAADFVFDVRCIPNPYWEPGLRTLTGLDMEVIHFLKQQPLADKMYAQIKLFLETWIPAFEEDNRSYMTVAIGCTGGQHRSVYLVNRLGDHFRMSATDVLVKHRELA